MNKKQNEQLKVNNNILYVLNSSRVEIAKQKAKQTSDLRRLIFSPPLPITAPTAYSQTQHTSYIIH